MNQAQRDRMQKAAEEYFPQYMQPSISPFTGKPFSGGPSETCAIKRGIAQGAFIAGYTQAAKDAQAALDIARGALDFYADDKTWIEEKKVGNIWTKGIEWDQGDTARVALAAIEKAL